MLAELEKVPRSELAITPTPLQETPRLAAAIGLDRLLVQTEAAVRSIAIVVSREFRQHPPEVGTH